MIKNIFFVFIGRILSVLISILFLPYLSRAMSKIEFGNYAQYLLLIEIAKVFLSFGISNIIYKLYSEKINRNNLVFSNSIFYFTLISFLGSSLIFIFSQNIALLFNNIKLNQIIVYVAFTVVFETANLILNSSFLYFNQVKKQVFLTIFINLLKLIYIYICIQIYKNPVYIYPGLVVISVFQFLIGIKLINKVSFRFNLIRFRYFKKIFSNTFYYGLTTLFGYLFIITDNVIVSNKLGVEKYAIFRNGLIQIPILSSMFGILNQVILPNIAQKVTNKESNSIILLKRKISTHLIALTFPPLIMILIFHKEFIVFFLSFKYVDSSLVFLIYNINLFFQVNDYEDIIVYSGKSHLIVIIYIFGFIFNILLNFILIDIFSIYGAAIATLLTNILLLITLNYFSTKLMQISFFSFFNKTQIFKTILLSLLGGLIVLLMKTNFHFLFSFFISFIIVLGIYLSFIKMKMLDEKIVKVFLDPFNKLKKIFNGI